MIERRPATTRFTQTQGETWDTGRRFAITLVEDEMLSTPQSRNGSLTIEWIHDDDTPGGKLNLGTAGIAALRQVLG